MVVEGLLLGQSQLIALSLIVVEVLKPPAAMSYVKNWILSGNKLPYY